MTALGARIARLIDAQGPLSLAEFMTIALHDPEEGYYATKSPLGADGDFITAPEISQIFGEMVGLWCVQVWRDQGRPSRLRLIELGPGRGTLMADLLRAARIDPDFLAALEIVLVEASPVLRDAQRHKLEGASVPLRWCAALADALAGDGPLLVIANEFFDCLPIRQYVRDELGWRERKVAVENGALAFVLAPGTVPLGCEAPLGAVIETSPASAALTTEIARAVAARGGAAVLVDYGYCDAGAGDTLQAVARHRFADVLAEPGGVDLSAHVDFGALAQAAKRAGAAVFGPVAQGDFLRALGADLRARALAAANPSQADQIMNGAARLLEPDQMGTLFKVLAIAPPHGAPALPGF